MFFFSSLDVLWFFFRGVIGRRKKRRISVGVGTLNSLLPIGVFFFFSHYHVHT